LGVGHAACWHVQCGRRRGMRAVPAGPSAIVSLSATASSLLLDLRNDSTIPGARSPSVGRLQSRGAPARPSTN
jgi:hypothetical protein